MISVILCTYQVRMSQGAASTQLQAPGFGVPASRSPREVFQDLLEEGLSHFGKHRRLRARDYQRVRDTLQEWGHEVLQQGLIARGSRQGHGGPDEGYESSSQADQAGEGEEMEACGVEQNSEVSAGMSQELSENAEQAVAREQNSEESAGMSQELSENAEQAVASAEYIEPRGSVARDIGPWRVRRMEQIAREDVARADEADLAMEGGQGVEFRRRGAPSPLLPEPPSFPPPSSLLPEPPSFPPPLPLLPEPPMPVVQHIHFNYYMLPQAEGVSLSRRPGKSRSRSRGEPRAPRQEEKVGWCVQCKKPKSECYKLGDWECPVCGTHNYASKPRCTNKTCSSLRASESSSSGDIWCKACKTWRSLCVKKGDWICPSCANHNYCSKEVCGHCGGGKPPWR